MEKSKNLDFLPLFNVFHVTKAGSLQNLQNR